MIDLKLLQKDFDTMSAKLTRKGVDVALLEKLKEKSEELKVAKINFETLQALQNSMSKEFGVYKKEGKDISELKAKVDANKIEIAKVLDIQREKTAELESMAMAIPNVPDDSVPDGAVEDDTSIVSPCVCVSPIVYLIRIYSAGFNMMSFKRT
jgi:seryl-tRNA synthetase